MDKKPSNVNFVIRLTVILAFFAVMLFPMCLMALDGPDQADASMQEDKIEMKPLSVQTYFDGSFQSTFESWLSKYYPLRSGIVSAFKNMKIEVENAGVVVQIMNTLRGDAFKPAPDDEICEMHVDDDFNGVCDVCGKQNLYGDILDNDPTNPDEPNDPGKPDEPANPDEPNDPGKPDEPDEPDPPKPPVNIYLDPNNIYSKINRLQYLQIPKEPTGFKGDSGIAIGKSGYLYEYSYMQEYLGVSGSVYAGVTDEGLQEMVDKMEYIQQELEKRGITMLYVISSSKASAYADYIPDHYKNSITTVPNYVRPIDRLRPMLAESSINYLDSAEYYKEIGLLVTFPKTGIHWNALASFETTAKLISMYRDLSGKQTVDIFCRGVLSYEDAPSSFNNEKDIFNILYGRVDPKYKAEAIQDDAYYAPDVVVGNQGAPKINVLLHGGSFAHSIRHYIQNYGVGNVTQSWYNDFTSSGHDPRTEGPEAWKYILEGKDLVIFEATEQQIRGGHWRPGMDWMTAANDGNIGHNAMYDSLYEYLKAHEGEY